MLEDATIWLRRTYTHTHSHPHTQWDVFEIIGNTPKSMQQSFEKQLNYKIFRWRLLLWLWQHDMHFG